MKETGNVDADKRSRQVYSVARSVSDSLSTASQ